MYAVDSGPAKIDCVLSGDRDVQKKPTGGSRPPINMLRGLMFIQSCRLSRRALSNGGGFLENRAKVVGGFGTSRETRLGLGCIVHSRLMSLLLELVVEYCSSSTLALENARKARQSLVFCFS